MFDIKLEGQGLVKLVGRLDASQTGRAREVLKDIQGPATLDLSELDYISSAGIGVIMETYKRLHGKSLSLRLVKLKPAVRAVFGFAGLESVLAIE
jgi:anti-sigma B factor antagonist